MGKIVLKIKGFFKRFFTLICSNIYGILYIVLLIILSKYIISNWDKCISMKFFEQFDGNNILFLVWIALIILFFYDVEAKDFKFHRRKYKNMNRQYQSADMNYHRTQTNTPSNQVSNEENEGGNSNVQPRQTVSD